MSKSSRWLLVLFGLFLSHRASPCNLFQGTRHVNPDGSKGGFVSSLAKVASTAYISSDAKVCDSAVVQGNAIVLDRAIIKSKSIVDSDTIISGSAIIADFAVIKGSANRKSKISDFSKVFGHAHVLDGSAISGNSSIYGGVKLYNVSASKFSKICEAFVLRDRSITDDSFCSPLDESSEGYFALASIDTKYLNEKSEKVRLSFLNGTLSMDINSLVVLVNNQIVHTTGLWSNGKDLEINSSFFVDGENKIEVAGKDNFGKAIRAASFEFMAGSQEIHLPISNIDSYRLIGEVAVGDDSYFVKVKNKNGEIVITGIPNGTTQAKFKVSGAGNKFFFNTHFEISSLPTSIDVYQYPEYINNNLDFENLSNDWSVNDPEYFEVIGSSVRILPSPENDLWLYKKVKLTKGEAGLELSVFSQSNELQNIPATLLEIILISLEKKTINNLSLHGYEFTRSHAFSSLNLTSIIPKNDVADGEYIVAIRVPAIVAKFMEDGFEVDPLRKKRFLVEFKPMNLFPKNLIDQNILTQIGPNYCDNRGFDISPRNKLSNYQDTLRAFSVGTSALMPGLTENIIFGDLNFLGAFKEELLTNSIALVGRQINSSGIPVEVFRQSLSECGLARLNRALPTPFLFLNQPQNIRESLFNIPFTKLTSDSIGITAGKRIELYVETKVTWAPNPIKSNSHFLPLLTAPNLSANYHYGDAERYDFAKKNQFRTGGDKWILPSYSEHLRQLILDYNSFWKVGDITKLNGGSLGLVHETHNAGLDADITFDDFHFEQIQDGDSVKWKFILDKINNFLVSAAQKYQYIRNFYITGGQTKLIENVVKIIDPSGQVRKRFDNRCFEVGPTPNQIRRYIQLDSASSQFSLLRHVEDHYNHLHVRFNISESLTEISNPPINFNYDISKLTFFLVKIIIENKSSVVTQFEIYAIPDNINESKKILWRLQDKPGFEGFDTLVGFGSWSNGNVKKAHIPAAPEILHLYFTTANTSNGGCSGQEYLSFRPDDLMKSGSRKVGFRVSVNGEIKML